MSLHRLSACLLLGTLCISLPLGITACSPSVDPTGGPSDRSSGLVPSADPRLDAGRLLVESKCDMCHTLDRIETAQKDTAGWTATVQRMRRRGAVVSDAEAQQIIDYLSSR